MADTMYLPNIIPRQLPTPIGEAGTTTLDKDFVVNDSTLLSSRCSEEQNIEISPRALGSFYSKTNSDTVPKPQMSLTVNSDVHKGSVETFLLKPDCSSTQPFPDSNVVSPKIDKEEEGRLYGPEPEGAIGLQAWQIRWEGKGMGGETVYQAGQPWWRDSDV